MTRQAFILSRPADFRIAQRCAVHLAGLGWHPKIMVDPEEWPDGAPAMTVTAGYGTKGRGMIGNACAAAIMRGIIDNSDGSEIVMKTDCDVRLSENGSKWLSGASDVARAMELGGAPWGGIWAAPAGKLAAARDLIMNGRQCKCPESALCLSAFRHTCGIEVVGTVSKWQFESPLDDAEAWTLPMRSLVRPRLEYGLRLFDFAP